MYLNRFDNSHNELTRELPHNCAKQARLREGFARLPEMFAKIAHFAQIAEKPAAVRLCEIDYRKKTMVAAG